MKFSLLLLAVMALAQTCTGGHGKGGTGDLRPGRFNIADCIENNDPDAKIVTDVWECPVHGNDNHGLVFTLILHYVEDAGCGVYELVQTFIEETLGEEHGLMEFGRWDVSNGFLTLTPFDGKQNLYFGAANDETLVMLDQNRNPVSTAFNYTLERKGRLTSK